MASGTVRPRKLREWDPKLDDRNAIWLRLPALTDMRLYDGMLYFTLAGMATTENIPPAGIQINLHTVGALLALFKGGGILADDLKDRWPAVFQATEWSSTPTHWRPLPNAQQRGAGGLWPGNWQLPVLWCWLQTSRVSDIVQQTQDNVQRLLLGAVKLRRQVLGSVRSSRGAGIVLRRSKISQRAVQRAGRLSHEGWSVRLPKCKLSHHPCFCHLVHA
jgi:hypothetical protein